MFDFQIDAKNLARVFIMVKKMSLRQTAMFFLKFTLLFLSIVPALIIYRLLMKFLAI